MGNPDNLLLDDGTFVQFSSHIMARGANQFYPSIKSLVIGASTNKTGKETVVNVDHLTCPFGDHRFRDDLHETRKDGQFDVMGVKQAVDLFEGFGFGL